MLQTFSFSAKQCKHNVQQSYLCSDIVKVTIVFPLVIQVHFSYLSILLVQVQAGVRQVTVSASVTTGDKVWSITALGLLSLLLPFTICNFDLE